MYGEPNRVQTAFGEMRAVYVSYLPKRFEEIRETWAKAREQQWNRAILVNLHSLVYSMAGSCAVFGFNAMAKTAYELQYVLASVIDYHQIPTAEWEQHVEKLLDDLEEACTHIQDTTTISLPLPSTTEPEHPRPQETPKEYQIAILTEDEEFWQDVPQLAHFGYHVSRFTDQEAFARYVVTRQPDAVIIDLDRPDSLEAATRTRRSGSSSPLLLFISTKNDILVRLDAVRAGGEAFFSKPVDINILIDRLEALINHREAEPYRILIVEDEPAVAEFYAYVLQDAGFVTHIVTRPLEEIMSVLVDFQPDLILMDIYMPECSGVELAKIIRHIESFVTVPIVFLSGEQDVEKQLDAMSLGGDDFILKPVEPEYLVKSVHIRAKRSRILRQLTVRDSLTGLLNHTAIEEQLAKEIERAARQGLQVAFAMIDLDHFKRVNDTYGHLVGDRVLRSLARVLQQRLRKTDIIGRYGGEEFAVILLDTDSTHAARILDTVRENFARIKHRAGYETFTVTFSGGVAMFPQYSSFFELHDAADKALYEAKRKGRNQVVIAEPTGFRTLT